MGQFKDSEQFKKQSEADKIEVDETKDEDKDKEVE